MAAQDLLHQFWHGDILPDRTAAGMAEQRQARGERHGKMRLVHGLFENLKAGDDTLHHTA
ncbi:hypothetical protein D3C80_1164120 [compost metagenome]